MAGSCNSWAKFQKEHDITMIARQVSKQFSIVILIAESVHRFRVQSWDQGVSSMIIGQLGLAQIKALSEVEMKTISWNPSANN